MKKALLALLFLLPVLALANDRSEFPVYVVPENSSGDAIASTTFNYNFVFASDSSCTSLLNVTENITTDKKGWGYANLDISSLSTTPSHLCTYRDGVLKNVTTVWQSYFENRTTNASELTTGTISLSRFPTLGTWTLTSILNITGSTFQYNNSEICTAKNGLCNQSFTDTDTFWNLTGSNWLYNNSGVLEWNETRGNATYLTSYTESDPLWVANYSGYNKTSWDTAYGWGDHSGAGYLTSYTETDPEWSANYTLVGFLADAEVVTGVWNFQNNMTANGSAVCTPANGLCNQSFIDTYNTSAQMIAATNNTLNALSVACGNVTGAASDLCTIQDTTDGTGGWTNNSQNTTTSLNVGIGTTTPAGQLHVYSDAVGGQVTVFESVGKNSEWQYWDNGTEVVTNYYDSLAPAYKVDALKTPAGNHLSIVLSTSYSAPSVVAVPALEIAPSVGGDPGEVFIYNNLTVSTDILAYGDGYFWGNVSVNDGEAVCTAENGLCGSGGANDTMWNLSGTDLYTAGNYNVGIGDTTPDATLDVEGDGLFSGHVNVTEAVHIGTTPAGYETYDFTLGSPTGGLVLQRTTAGAQPFTLLLNSLGSGGQVRAFPTGAGLQLTSSTASTVYMNLSTAGIIIPSYNVGIGTSNPDAMLELYKYNLTYDMIHITGRTPAIIQEVHRIRDADTGAALQFFKGEATNQNSTQDIIELGAVVQMIQSAAPNLDYFYIGDAYNDNAFRIQADKDAVFYGNVGVGTSSPSAELDVVGDVEIDGGSLDLNGTTIRGFVNSGTTYLGIYPASGNAAFQFDGAASVNIDGDRGNLLSNNFIRFFTAGTYEWSFGMYADGTNNLHIRNPTYGGVPFFINHSNNNLELGGSTGGGAGLGNPALFIDAANKYVGIGTTSPAEALDVAGNISLTGTVMPDNACGISGAQFTSEESAALSTGTGSGRQFSWGNGATSSYGPAQPCSGTIVAMTMTCAVSGASTGRVQVALNGAAQGTGCEVSSPGSAQSNDMDTSCSVAFTAGDMITPITTTSDAATSNCAVTMFVRYD